MIKRKNIKEFINSAIQIHGNKYDYSLVKYINNKTKVKIICPEHGIFEQIPSLHIGIKKCGCPKCAKIKLRKINLLTQNEYISKCKKVHKNFYNYSLTIYKDSKTKVKIICPIHGIFEQNSYSHLRGCGCPLCAKNQIKNKNKKTQNQIINSLIQIHGNKYDYSLVEYVNCHTKIKIICPEHGMFEQTVSNHKSYGCSKCNKQNKRKITLKNIIKKSKEIHNNKYQYEILDISKNKIKIICPIHGSFIQNIYDHHYHSAGCPSCSHIISKEEIELQKYIKNIYKGKVETNNKNILDNKYEIDIFIPEKNIAFEFNGIYWHSEISGNKNRRYHIDKTINCEKKGIQLFHIFEYEWKYKKDIVKSMIKSKLGLITNKIYARNCEIKNVNIKNKNEFLEKNHIQGKCNSSYNIGLYYKNILVSIMTFTKSRFNKKYKWELSRFCSKIDYIVIGGFSRILSYFIKHYNKSIISYADKRWSNGKVYKNNKFNIVKITEPTYFYTKDHLSLIRKENFRLDKIKRNLIYNSNLSEWENMKNNGYDRIWDCGKIVFDLI